MDLRVMEIRPNHLYRAFDFDQGRDWRVCDIRRTLGGKHMVSEWNSTLTFYAQALAAVVALLERMDTQDFEYGVDDPDDGTSEVWLEFPPRVVMVPHEDVVALRVNGWEPTFKSNGLVEDHATLEFEQRWVEWSRGILERRDGVDRMSRIACSGIDLINHVLGFSSVTVGEDDLKCAMHTVRVYLMEQLDGLHGLSAAMTDDAGKVCNGRPLAEVA